MTRIKPNKKRPGSQPSKENLKYGRCKHQIMADANTTGKYNILAILSLVFGVTFYPAGLVLGIIALLQIKKNPEQKGKLLAYLGIFLIPGIVVLITLTGLVLGFIRGMIGAA